MKEIINFYYNIDIKDLKKIEDNYEFIEKGSIFLLCVLNRTEEDLKNIYEVCEELKRKNIPIHTFILNRENKLVSNIENQNYVLLKMESKDEEINILDIMNFQENLILSKNKSSLYNNSWGNLWSRKIDYFEYQVHELGKNKSVILNSLSYYIGLAENAISYANNTVNKINISEFDKISLSHKRVKFPNFKIDFYNPLLFIFDLQVRDIAEYLKSAFFIDEKDAWIEFKTFLSLRKRTLYEYQMFFARMLYPSYYFDVYEKIMNHEEDEETLIKIIDKNQEYEKFLSRIMLELNKMIGIEKIEWLIKK